MYLPIVSTGRFFFKGGVKIFKSKLYIAGALSIIAMCISGIYAFTNTSVTKVDNTFVTGSVKIELNEYTVGDDGKEKVYNGVDDIAMPGDEVSIIPRISNLGESSYIRAKVSFISDSGTLVLSDSDIKGIKDKWVKRGSYWYYTEPVETAKNIDIFESVVIPSRIGNENQGKTVQLSVVAEAVQSSNFTPDFESNSPWKNIEIKKNLNEDYQTDKVQNSATVKIQYENNANKYMVVPDNFFMGLGNLLPNSTVTSTVKINADKNNTKYYFKTGTIAEATQKQQELLEKMQLKISLKDKVLYNGSLYQPEKQPLGTYKSNETAELKFEITVPEEMDNDYAMMKTTISWTFMVDTDVPEEPTPEKPKPEEPKPEPEKPAPEPEKPSSPQTGDVKIRIAIIIFIISAICLLVTICVGKKRTNDVN